MKVTQPSEISSERGQTTIFVAVVLLFVLLPMVGVVIEGGRMVATYRKMQAAADLAALVAAQKLPTASTARQDGCEFARRNGFGAGWSAGSCQPDSTGGTVTVCVPPQAKSPYDWMPFTTGGVTPCDPAATSSRFVEVQITENVGTVPIFNIPVSLYAHAVARSGIPGVADYAIIALDPTGTAANGIEMDGLNNGIVAYGSVSSNNSNSNSSIKPPSGTASVCAGSFLTAGTEPNPGSIATYNNGSTPAVTFAPAGCVGPADTPSPDWLPRAGLIADPYATTPNPSACTNTTDCSTADGNMYTNCHACGANGWYTSPTGTGWTQANPSGTVRVSGKVEFFPGVYGGISMSGNDVAIFNPGIYTITGTFQINGGTVCIFGAPVCDHIASSQTLPSSTTNCANTDFTNANTPSATWYYYCSPYGFWDTSTHGGGRPAILTTAPTFLNTTTGDTTGMKQLNGVTFYLKGASTAFTGADMAIAAPNPCAGTRTQSGLSVPFPYGSTALGGYTYPASSYPALTPGGAVSPSNTYIYPTLDFTRDGECVNPGAVWANEFGGNPPSQHMQFLFWQQEDTNQEIKVTGNGNYNWYGVVHSFKPYSTDPFPPPPSTPCFGSQGCNVTLGGNAGAGQNGPPMLFGQVIGNTDKFHGSSILMVFNRPGGLASGPGTSLIE